MYGNTTPKEVSKKDSRNRSNTSAGRTVTPQPLPLDESDDDSTNSVVEEEVPSDDEEIPREDLIDRIKILQVAVKKSRTQIQELKRQLTEMTESADRKASEMLVRAQVQYFNKDERMFRRINALVHDKIFSYKKFITSQRDLDEFTDNNSLGSVIMTLLKVEKPDRLPFWNAYKEIVADAIANRRTTITNDLKKVVMSKYSTTYNMLSDTVSLSHYNLFCLFLSGIKADNKALNDQGKEVPSHKQLPTLEDILKLRQAPQRNNNTAFTFMVEHLAGTVIGQRKWKTTRCYAPLNKHMSVSDEAFMLLVLENQYDLWVNSDTASVGRGQYTKNGPNKKFCGWTNEGMRRFNQLLDEVRANRLKQYSKEVEDATFKTLAERYKTTMGMGRKNSRKRRRHVTDDSDQEDNQGVSNSIIPEDELFRLAQEMEEV